MKLLFPLALTLAVASGVPLLQMTAEDRLALLQAEKSSLSLQREVLPKQGHVVQEEPQGPVAQEQHEQHVAEQGPVAQEEPVDESLQEDKIMNNDALPGEEQWDGYVMGEGLGKEPDMEEGLGEEPVMGEEEWQSPVIGQADSLKREAEREELPQRSTVLRYDMIQEEPVMEERPTIGEDLWEGPVKGEKMGEGRVMEIEPQGQELYSTLPRQVGEEEDPTLAKNSLEDMSYTGCVQACGGVIISGRCYQFFRGPKKAYDSEFFCQDNFLNGHLASVTSRYIHLSMMKLMAQNGGYTRTWIGGFNYLKTGRFLWLDGSSWGYADWLPGEPNNTADVEDCVELLSNGKFNDMPCWDLRAFICSYPLFHNDLQTAFPPQVANVPETYFCFLTFTAQGTSDDTHKKVHCFFSSDIMAEKVKSLAVNMTWPLQGPSRVGGDSDHHSEASRVVQMVITVAIFTMGIPLNTLVVWVLGVRGPRAGRAGGEGRGAGTFRVYVVNLALADLVLVLRIPLMLGYLVAQYSWPFGHTACRFIMFLRGLGLYANAFLLCAISAERCLCLLRPVWFRMYRPRWTVLLACALLWLLATALSAPYIATASIVPIANRSQCFESHGQAQGLFITETVLGFLLPLLLFLATNLAVLVTARQAGGAVASPSPSSSVQSSKRLVRLYRVLFLTMLLFLTCWVPYFTFRFLLRFSAGRADRAWLFAMSRTGVYVSLYLVYAKSALNPVLYVFAARGLGRTIRASIFSAVDRIFNEETSDYSRRRSLRRTDSQFYRRRMEGMDSGEMPGGGEVEARQIDSGGSDSPPDFPYGFDREGRLLHKGTQEPFVFHFRRGGTRDSEQEHEALGRCITQHVYRVLEEQYHLRRIYLPPPRPGPIFLSPGALEGAGTLLVLIQDQGTVRCGQWSWQAIVREGLERGSQVPYVRRALQERWGVVLLNPNEAGASPEEHVRSVWDGPLAGCAAGRVVVVTHGYGGLAFVDLLSRRPLEVQRRVCAVAFVDSTHNLWHQPLAGATRDWLRAHSRKWVLSVKPLNRPVGSLKAGCHQLSAGTQNHEAAPAFCMDSVFRYIAKALRAKPPPTPSDIVTRSRSLGRGRPSGGGAKQPGRGAKPCNTNGNKI
ncbi:hypothetical protein AAFF_G00308310 [Aldrovandia affinis]|uniref:C-type lectin domain-containing protein n=1 Tax=Aldrovandia affinis TaxID=143900 RepID=A0AAD7WR50_9TELE|nr:hypothetical protein AAFF_G00308310 [Aldrovandia affinis]